MAFWRLDIDKYERRLDTRVKRLIRSRAPKDHNPIATTSFGLTAYCTIPKNPVEATSLSLPDDLHIDRCEARMTYGPKFPKKTMRTAQ